MTAWSLLAYISASLLLQTAAGIAVTVWRRRALATVAPLIEASGADKSASTAWPGWREFRVTRRQFEDAAKSQCSFHLQPVDGAALPSFKPGQYLTFSLQLGGQAGAARVVTRCYSLSDRPLAERYRITIKRVPASTGQPGLPPGLSSNHFHDRVQVGDVLQVKAPAGSFFLDADVTTPAVLIAGGIGITPLLSMLRWCVEEQPQRVLHLYYGVHNSADHAFKQTLEALDGAHPALSLNIVYSRPESHDVQGRDHQHVGHIDLQLLRSTLPHGRNLFYVCGPPPMMQSLVPALRAWGVQESDLHFESFGSASVRPTGSAANELPADAAVGMEVRLIRSGRTLVWNGEDANLLDFFERQGVAVESGCRSGGCGTCETRLVSGTVSYDKRPDHAIAQGHCLPCVGKPSSALELDA